jgi:hypothetical protein
MMKQNTETQKTMKNVLAALRARKNYIHLSLCGQWQWGDCSLEVFTVVSGKIRFCCFRATFKIQKLRIKIKIKIFISQKRYPDMTRHKLLNLKSNLLQWNKNTMRRQRAVNHISAIAWKTRRCVTISRFLGGFTIYKYRSTVIARSR